MKIETVAYQEALRAAVKKRMLEENLYIPGLEKGVKPRTRKSERLLSLVPLFAKGEFFFRSQDTEAQAEFLSYPKGKHDDVMEALSSSIKWSVENKNKVVFISKFLPNYEAIYDIHTSQKQINQLPSYGAREGGGGCP